jgi:hypothetical protein
VSAPARPQGLIGPAQPDGPGVDPHLLYEDYDDDDEYDLGDDLDDDLSGLVGRTDLLTSPVGSPTDTPSAPSVARVRVVLAERRRFSTPVRTVEVVQDGTGVGEMLRASLIRTQLAVAVRFAAVVALTLGALPLLFTLVPEIGQAEVLGLRVVWLLLGVLVYPFLLGVGWWHTRTAERVEQGFADHVQD